jgi:hypothetical protein
MWKSAVWMFERSFVQMPASLVPPLELPLLLPLLLVLPPLLLLEPLLLELLLLVLPPLLLVLPPLLLVLPPLLLELLLELPLAASVVGCESSPPPALESVLGPVP